MYDRQKLWLNRLSHLNPNVSHDRGPGAGRFAPHKPLLLLALIESAEAGEITSDRIPLTAGLRLRFNALWQIVVSRWQTRPDPRLPFHHLSTQKFWSARRLDGSPSEGPDSTKVIAIDPDFLALLSQPQFRQLARIVLIRTWFPPAEQIGLAASLNLALGEDKAEHVVEETRAIYERTCRDARFRVQVIVQYHYQCALTGYTLTATDSGATIVQAAHIAAFADTRNNDSRNGLALTPDAHWSFDEGLWTIGDDLRVVVARDMFADWSPLGTSLKRHHGQPLHFSPGTSLRPQAEYLAWHRTHRFVGPAAHG